MLNRDFYTIESKNKACTLAHVHIYCGFVNKSFNKSYKAIQSCPKLF